MAFLAEYRDRIYHVDCKEARKRLDGRSRRLGSHLPWGDPRRGWDFVSAGRGDIGWEDIFRMLNSIGYRGPILRLPRHSRRRDSAGCGSALPGRHRGDQGGPHRLHRAGTTSHQLHLRNRLVQQHGETADHRAARGQG